MRRLLLVCLSLATTLSVASAAPTRRVAVIVGAADYGGQGDLLTTTRDARAMGEVLSRLGFETHVLQDPKSGAVEKTFADLQGRGAPIDTLAFFFAGHGGTLDNQSVLALNDGGPRRLRLDALPLASVLSAARRLSPRATLIMLDACRTDAGAHLPGSATGLAPPPRAAGTFFAYAAAPGDLAFDGPRGGLSIFTLALADELLVPDQDIGVVMRRVRERVAKATGGRELPWTEDSLTGALILNEAPAAPQLFGLYGRALKGEASAERDLGLAYLNGHGIAKDEQRGLALLGQAAAQKDVPALLSLGDFEARRGRNALFPGSRARQWYRQAAALGSGEGWSRLAELDRKAQPVDRPPTAAMRDAYRHAAEHGSLDARARLLTFDLVGATETQRARTITALRQIAAKGNLLAEETLGAVYTEPGHKDTDFAEGDFWLAKAVREGSTAALLTQAKNYGNGRGRPIDKPKSFALTVEAAKAGDPLAMLFAGRMQQQGEGTAPDRAAAVDWFRKATEAGNTEAFADLGFAYESGFGVDKDLAQAVAIYKQGAALNDPVATRYLAVMYEGGDGVHRNLDKAIAYYERAADLGDARAQASLAVLATNGMLTSAPDFALGARLLKQAVAHSEDGEYIFKLAQMTEKGKGMPADPAAAAKLFERAAGYGNAEALSEFAAMTMEGKGVPRDVAKAEMLFRKAAAAGDPVAYADLAIILRDRGRAAHDDPTILAEAGRWSRRGAEAGNADAMEMYASDLLAGDEGFAQDVHQGLEWLEKALAGGDFYAARKLGTFAAGKLDVPQSWRDDSLIILVKAATQANNPLAKQYLQLVWQDLEGVDMEHGNRAALEKRLDGPQHGMVALLLGIGFEDGRFNGGKPDPVTAKRYLEMAGKAGQPEAWHHIGDLELAKRVPNATPEKAFAAVKKGADANDLSSLDDIGDLYRKGIGTKVDDAKAFDAFKSAAERGFAPAMYNLALCYERGVGTPPSRDDAERWYQQAVIGGEEDARGGLVSLLLDAAPEERDYSRALFNLFQLAMRKHPEVVRTLADMARDKDAPKWARQRAVTVLDAARKVMPAAAKVLEQMASVHLLKPNGNGYVLAD